ncbi:DUF6230 family protein [Nonomuraea gerenzanensis]|uniref:Putative cholesterol esterase n=1 Tax=Nonomuraea gerenzanensis TaxID=93944 RepID=A0A1M4EEH3_9ACTN|nr:DUF6230 family protein [Nonomuraea gerenzanensis]UBU08912.1 DUF6230 family protein [Nonomuraea gerenzanensis]SBO97289.1 putative cholesterol esterase [Nonomuraea gerenzanensis]
MAELGRVRWKRFAWIFAPVAATTTLLVGATAQGVIGATFVVSGNSFKLFAGELRGQGFALSSNVVRTRKDRLIPVITTGVRRAVVTGLCQSALVKTPLGTVTIELTGGRNGNEVTIDDLVIDVAAGRTASSLRELELGRDAATLDEVPDARGPAGTFGSQARSVVLRNVRLEPWAATAATFSLPDLGLRVLRGVQECF